MRDVVRRWNTIPFETLMGWFAVYAAVAGLFHVGTSSDALDAVIGQGLSTVLQGLYLLSGIGILIGLGTGRSTVEAPAIVALIVSVLVRGVALIGIVGATKETLGALVLYALIAYFGGVRIRHLWNGDVVVLIHPLEDEK